MRTAYYVMLEGNDYLVYRTDDRTNNHVKMNSPFPMGLLAWTYIKEDLTKDTAAVYCKLPPEMHQPGDGCLRQCFMITETQNDHVPE